MYSESSCTVVAGARLDNGRANNSGRNIAGVSADVHASGVGGTNIEGGGSGGIDSRGEDTGVDTGTATDPLVSCLLGGVLVLDKIASEQCGSIGIRQDVVRPCRSLILEDECLVAADRGFDAEGGKVWPRGGGELAGA